MESPDEEYADDYSHTEEEKGKPRSNSKSVEDSDATKDQLNYLFKSLEKIIDKKESEKYSTDKIENILKRMENLVEKSKSKPQSCSHDHCCNHNIVYDVPSIPLRVPSPNFE